nr:NAD(P)/FAD-dependent oxidoreductase [Methanomicrobia archaeon]
MKEERYDVVVVGAGPAGSVTAKTAAERGLDVLLIERNQEIGVPVKCAEGVSKEIEKFVAPDRRWICAEVKGANIYGPDGTKVVLSAETMDETGYVLERMIFDKFLAIEAARAGAEIRVRAEAYDLIEEDGYAKGVYVRCMGEDTRIFAPVVVGADGVESKVGRWAGINTRLQPSNISVCAEFLMCDIELNGDYSEFFLGSEVAPKGYAWVFPKGGDCANVGLGIGGDVSDEKHRALDYLKAFVRNKFPDGKTVAEMYGVVPLSGPSYESVADGLILVGDAARQVNPLTGGGILYAMQAGKIAGDVIAKAVQEKDCSKKRLLEYENRWRSEFGKRLETGF